MGYYSHSDFVRSKESWPLLARRSMSAFEGCILVFDLTRLEPGRMCCLTKRAVIALEILIEAGRPNPQIESLTNAPLRIRWRNGIVWQTCYARAINVFVIVVSGFVFLRQLGLYGCIWGRG